MTVTKETVTKKHQDTISMEEANKIFREAMLKAAKDLNEVLGLTPQIDLEADSDVLIEQLKKAGGLVDPQDELKPETREVLSILEKKEGKEGITREKAIPRVPKKEKEKEVEGVPRKKNLELFSLLSSLISTGKHTSVEIVNLVQKQFPRTPRGTIQTILSDGKNPKYCGFEKLVVKKEKGFLSFVKKK